MEKLHEYLLPVNIHVKHIGYVKWKAYGGEFTVVDRNAWWALGQLVHRLHEEHGKVIIESIKIDGFERLREEKVWQYGRSQPDI